MSGSRGGYTYSLNSSFSYKHLSTKPWRALTNSAVGSCPRDKYLGKPTPRSAMDDYDISEPEHPDKRERPHDVASLLVMKAEWPDLRTICVARGATLIGVKPLPMINGFDVEVLCSNP